MISKNTVKGLKEFLKSADSSLKISGKKSELLARKVRYLTYSCIDSDFKHEFPSRDYRVSADFYMRLKYYGYICLQHKLGNISESAEKVSEEEESESKECESECCICMEGISADLFSAKCGHKFHGKCIAEWFKRCSQCPLCRAEIDKKVTRQRVAYTVAVENRTEIVTDKRELHRILFSSKPRFSGDDDLFKKVRDRLISNLREGLDKVDEIYLEFYRTDGRMRIADLTDEQVINHIY